MCVNRPSQQSVQERSMVRKRVLKPTNNSLVNITQYNSKTEENTPHGQVQG